MKNLKLSAAVLAGLMVVFSSCKKDKDEAAPSKSKTEYLTTAKGWKVTSQSIAGQNVPLEDCEKSSLQIYKTDKTYTDSNTDECGGNDSGTWEFTNNDTQIIIDDETFKIDQLDGSTFKFSFGTAPAIYQIVMTAQK